MISPEARTLLVKVHMRSVFHMQRYCESGLFVPRHLVHECSDHMILAKKNMEAL